MIHLDTNYLIGAREAQPVKLVTEKGASERRWLKNWKILGVRLWQTGTRVTTFN